MDSATVMLLLLIGFLAGGYGTIVGAGGGFIFVPALLLIFQMPPTVAAASGLVLVFINSLSGVAGYARSKSINYKIGIPIGVGALPGSIIGVWLLQAYASTHFYPVFASMLVSLGIFLFVKNSPFRRNRTVGETGEFESNDAANNEPEEAVPSLSRLLPLGFLMGIFSSYLGIGGGWLLVPILIYLFKISPHKAAAVSVFSICIYSSIGVVTQLFYSQIDWLTVLWGGIGVTIGAHIGVLSSKKIPGNVIIQMLSVLLVVIGIRMYFQ